MHRDPKGRRNPRAGPIAVSFHRLFLGGLLPSRARFRFAGSQSICLQSKPPQPRRGNSVPQFPCLTQRVQSSENTSGNSVPIDCFARNIALISTLDTLTDNLAL